MLLVVYPAIQRKLLSKHQVTVIEVEEAFLNRMGKLAKEVRPQNEGSYPRYWFIADTNDGRRLKIVFVHDPNEVGPVIITAFEPDETEEDLYASLQ